LATHLHHVPMLQTTAFSLNCSHVYKTEIRVSQNCYFTKWNSKDVSNWLSTSN